MTLLQVWLFIGIPALALATACFLGRSWWRSLVGYAVLAVGFVLVAVFSPASGAAIGALIALLYAAGRGGQIEGEYDPVSDTSLRAVAAMEPPEQESVETAAVDA